MVKRHRVLIVAHGHPEISPGGAEVAAMNLHRTLLQDPSFDSVLLARHDDPQRMHGGTPFAGTGQEREILFRSSTYDRFLFSQPDKAKVWRDFRDVLDTVQPDIVHFHHYLHLGLELLGEVKRYRSDLPVLMTLHEYFAICHAGGRMMKQDSNNPCYGASPLACHQCFPQRSPQDFMLRERFIKSYFRLVDQFFAPSQFLADRYVDWGIDEKRIHVIENLLEADAEHPTTATTERKGPLRVSYFGQINHHKGIDLLLDAIGQLEPQQRLGLTVNIHGSGLDKLHWKLRWRLQLSARKLGSHVRFCGPYRRDELASLMQNTDWMIIPSRWWENSPVVILEARRHGVPVVCSDIGGMAEKIEPGVTGLHFRCGDSAALTARLLQMLEDADAGGHLQKRLAAAIAESDEQASLVKQHIDLHRRVLRGTSHLAPVSSVHAG